MKTCTICGGSKVVIKRIGAMTQFGPCPNCKEGSR